MNRAAVLIDANTASVTTNTGGGGGPDALQTAAGTMLLRDNKNSGNRNSNSSSSSSKRLGLLGSPLKLGKRRNGSATIAVAPPLPLEAAVVVDESSSQPNASSPTSSSPSRPQRALSSKSSSRRPSPSKRHPNAYEALHDDDEEDDDREGGGAESSEQQRRDIFRGLECAIGAGKEEKEAATAPASSVALQAASSSAESSSSWSAVAPPAAPAVAPPRRSRQYFSKLPTLDETSSSESDAGFEDDDRDNAAMLSSAVGTAFVPDNGSAPTTTNSPPRSKAQEQVRSTTTTKTPSGVPGPGTGPSATSSSMSLSAADPTKRRPGGGRTFQDRVRELVDRGDDLAARGKEEEALAVYKKALKVNRIETSRIKAQLKQVDGKHPSTVRSIASRLYEDWLEVGTSIAHVRSKMAVLAERVGDYDRALTCCAEAKGVYKRQYAFLERKKLDSAAVQKRAKTASRLHEQMSRAQKSFARRKQLHEEIVLLRRALAVEPPTGRPRQIRARLEELAQKALALETEMLGRDHPQVADTLSVLATLAAEADRLPEAVEYLEEATCIAQSALGARHPLTGELLLQMARAKASQPQVDVPSTLQNYRDALTVFREVAPSLVTSTLNEMSVLHIRQKEYAVAVELLNQALESSVTDGSTAASAVPLYRNLGECHSHGRDYPKAVEAFARALERQREIRGPRDPPGQPSPTREEAPPPSATPLGDDDALADTVRRLGKAYMGCGRPADALNMFGEALLIHRAAVLRAVQPSGGRPHDYGLPERQDQLAHTLFCIAEAREALGDAVEAERVYSESMQLRLFSDAHRADRRQNMIHCAMCLRGIGNVHLSRNEYEAAQRVFEDALRYCEGHGTWRPAFRTRVGNQTLPSTGTTLSPLLLAYCQACPEVTQSPQASGKSFRTPRQDRTANRESRNCTSWSRTPRSRSPRGTSTRPWTR